MTLYIVGMGPGGGADLTLRARSVLERCHTIIGYTTYLKLLGNDFSDKRLYSTPMRREEKRCRMALELAKDEDVALICSGDPGVYGMAGLCWELAEDYLDVSLEVIPGVTAALGGAAALGAPLGHDFALLSLSDLLTPWEEIELRLESAARAGFVLCLYNPASRHRPDHLRRACEILLRVLPPDTPCGFVRNLGREGEQIQLLSLEELRTAQVDMFTTVFIGTRRTKVIRGRLVTPRGYLRG